MNEPIKMDGSDTYIVQLSPYDLLMTYFRVNHENGIEIDINGEKIPFNNISKINVLGMVAVCEGDDGITAVLRSIEGDTSKMECQIIKNILSAE